MQKVTAIVLPHPTTIKARDLSQKGKRRVTTHFGVWPWIEHGTSRKYIRVCTLEMSISLSENHTTRPPDLFMRMLDSIVINILYNAIATDCPCLNTSEMPQKVTILRYRHVFDAPEGEAPPNTPTESRKLVYAL